MGLLTLFALPHLALANYVAYTPTNWSTVVGSIIPALLISLPMTLLIEPAAAAAFVGKRSFTHELRRHILLVNLVSNPIVVLLCFVLASLVTDLVFPVDQWMWPPDYTPEQALVRDWSIPYSILLVLEAGAVGAEYAYLRYKLHVEDTPPRLLSVVVVMNAASFFAGPAIWAIAWAASYVPVFWLVLPAIVIGGFWWALKNVWLGSRPNAIPQAESVLDPEYSFWGDEQPAEPAD